MKTMKRLILITILFLCCLITGCTEKNSATPSSLAIVYGDHGNNAMPNTAKALEFIKETCNSFGSISIITIDGNPFQSYEVDIPVQNKHLTQDKRKQITEQQAENIMELLKNSTAKTKETDPLSAITLAGRALNTQQESNMEMLILDSGLSTTGVLNLSEYCLDNINIERTVKQLKKNDAIPNLNGISVTWTGLGDTGTPQAKLSTLERSHLKELWSAILEESGANVTFTDDLPIGETDFKNLPEVSAVPTIQTTAILKDEKFTDNMLKDTPLKLDDTITHFKPGSAELLTSKKKICNILNPLITYMKKHPDYKILLAGTTASAGTQKELVKLSKERCNTIRKILTNAGINKKQIKTIGLGFKNHPYYIDDKNDDGSLNEKNAAKNRSVIIMGYESESAKKLK